MTIHRNGSAVHRRRCESVGKERSDSGRRDYAMCCIGGQPQGEVKSPQMWESKLPTPGSRRGLDGLDEAGLEVVLQAVGLAPDVQGDRVMEDPIRPRRSRPAACADPPVGLHRAGAGALPARLRCGADARGAAGVLAHGVRLAATVRGPPGPGRGAERQRHGHPALRRIRESQCSFPRAALRRCLHAREPDRAATLPPSAAADRCRHHGAAHTGPPPRAAARDPPGAVAGRRRRERSVRDPGAAVRWRRDGVAAGPGRARAARRGAGAPPSVGGRRDPHGAALSPARGLQPARRRGGAGAPAGSARAHSAATSCGRRWPWSG